MHLPHQHPSDPIVRKAIPGVKGLNPIIGTTAEAAHAVSSTPTLLSAIIIALTL
jgi:hypothetical protein